MMKYWICGAMALVLLPMFAPHAAAQYDGSQDLVCSVVQATTCRIKRNRSQCITSTASERNVPQFINIRFKERVFRLRGKVGSELFVEFEKLHNVGGFIGIQGVSKDRTNRIAGWTISIEIESGKMEVAGLVPDFGYFLYGSCTRL